MKQKTGSGKFCVKIESRYGDQFLQEKGKIELGTPWESDYIYWTTDIGAAMRFKTVKQARAIGRIIEAERGIRTSIVTQYGEAV